MSRNLPTAVIWVQLPLNGFSSGSEISHELHWSTNDFVAAFCNDWYILAWASFNKFLVFFLLIIEGID